MAEKYFVYYQVDSATPYPVVTVEREDDTQFLPDEMYSVEGWTKGTAVGNYNHAIFDSWYDEDGETTVGEWFVTPGSPPTRSKTDQDDLTLEERQASKQNELDQLVQDVAYTQLVSAKITSTLRASFKDYIEELQGISNSSSSYYQSTWATNPEAVVLPTKPTYTAHSTTTETQIRTGEALYPNSVGVLKQFIPDRETLQPEWGFEVNNFDDFDVTTTSGSGTIQFLGTTINRSGGYCLAVPSGWTINLVSKPENFFSVGEGDKISIETTAQFTSPNNVGATYVGLKLYDSAKVPLVTQPPLTTLTQNSSWTSSFQEIVVAAGAKWATVTLDKEAGTSGSVRFDAIRVNRVISLSRLPTITSQGVLGRSALTGDGPPEVLGPNNLRLILGVGFATGLGVGDVVTQSTDKTTAVTLNRLCGRINTHNQALAAGAAVRFNLNNSTIQADDILLVNVGGGITSNYVVTCAGCAAGAAGILIENRSGGPLSEAIQLNFAVVKGSVN